MLRIIPPEVIRPLSVKLPLSKSMANRLMVIRFLAGGGSDGEFPDCDDTRIMHTLIRQLITLSDSDEFNAGDAGTVFRFMAAVMAVTPGTRLLTGSSRMLQRPAGPLVDALVKLGASIDYTGNHGFPPLKISGGRLNGGSVTIDSSVSSQFISALMLIAPVMKHGLELKLQGETVSIPYIQLTARLMEENGIRVETELPRIRIYPGKYRLGTATVEADWSAAAFWYTLVALMPDSAVTLRGLRQDSAQGDRAVAVLSEKTGVNSIWTGNELILRHLPGGSSEISIGFTRTPDLFPAMVAACAGKGYGAEFYGLSTLRIKESDRIEAMIDGLSRLGYHAYAPARDRMVLLPGREKKEPAVISSFADHRIAMAFAMLSVKAGPLIIDCPEVVSKSYPAFWDHLKDAGFVLESC
ncbi:MAG: 3-phosphoshikimate 1-carboxyvinyltransferase [Lentimicrobium sp.]|nr:3-phosphoshikimate 1-carboxyvinyltransferase [Lentimicrobium sp.]